MATWTTVPDASLEPGKPIRSIDALALRDNPVAIAEGAAGAPKIDPINAMAHLGAAGAVGTYAFLVLGEASGAPNNASVLPGNTRAGSSLRYTSASGYNKSTSASAGGGYSDNGVFNTYVGSAPAGTWRCMGYSEDYNIAFDGKVFSPTLWLRIA